MKRTYQKPETEIVRIDGMEDLCDTMGFQTGSQNYTSGEAKRNDSVGFWDDVDE